MIACRDPLGIRPLVMGRLGDSYIFASETVALDVVGATYLRSVEPGELIEVSDRACARTARSRRSGRGPASSSMSISRGRTRSSTAQSVYQRPQGIGAELAIESPVEADLVVPVPDSGVPAAIGYAQAIGHSRSSSASSARTMSAAPSSSPATRSATWA